MSQKNFLITGAARGIGRGLTRLLLLKGHRVLLVDNNTTELEHMTTQLLPKWCPPISPPPPPPSSSCNTAQPQPQYKVHNADLTSQTSITTICETASTFFQGHLDVLINNAAHTSAATSDTTIDSAGFEDLWTQAVAVNLTAPVLLSRACLPMLRHSHSTDAEKASSREPTGGGGSIIHISSTRAHQSEANSEAYAATKAGLIGLTHSMACSLSSSSSSSSSSSVSSSTLPGVRVNAVLPGWIHVENECKHADENEVKWEEGLSEDDMRWHWTGRVGRVEDVFRAVEYLCDAGFVTGTEMVVDGGVSRRMVYPE